jgi:hypothetical protein
MVYVTGVTTQIGIMLVKLVTVLVVADVVYLLLNAKNEDFKYLLNKFLSLVRERKRKVD